MIWRIKRNTGKKRSTCAGCRLDLERSADQHQALTHPVEAKTAIAAIPGIDRRNVKAATVILNNNLQCRIHAADNDADIGGLPRMLDNVCQSLLNDAINGRADFTRNLVDVRVVTLEIGFSGALLAPVGDVAGQRLFQAEFVDGGRAEFPRDPVQGLAQVFHLPSHEMQTLPGGVIDRWIDLVQLQYCSDKALAGLV